MFSPGQLLTAIEAEVARCNGRVEKLSTYTTALSQHCLCGSRAKKTLDDRVHECDDCGFRADRDVLAALLAAACDVIPGRPDTAVLNKKLAFEILQVHKGQQDALVKSTGHHQLEGPGRSFDPGKTGSEDLEDSHLCLSKHGWAVSDPLDIKSKGLSCGCESGKVTEPNHLLQKHPPDG